MSFLGIALHVIVVGAVAAPACESIEGECSTSDPSAQVAASALVQKAILVERAQAASFKEDAEVPLSASYLTSLASVRSGGVQCKRWCEPDYNAGKNQGRHCSPGDMAHLCGGCSFCEGAPADTCDEASWPDNERKCGECKILVDRFNSVHGTCNNFCASVGRECVDAWEEQAENCKVKYDMTCDQSIASSDAICQCGDELAGSDACWGQLNGIAADEGNELAEVNAASADSCKQACYSTSGCNSFSYCPEQSKCWLKDRSFTGGEATTTNGECRTHYKTTCGVSPTPAAPTPTATSAPPTPAAPTPTATSAPPTPPTPGPCESWCESDYNGGNNQGRHCSPGDMASLCGGCAFCGSAPSPIAPGPPGSSIRVMSYNTEYKGYRDGRMGNFAAKIREVAPAIVGLQECQDRDGLASQTGYIPLSGTGNQNYILFDSSKVSFVSDGWMRIPRDKYAERAITWGQFRLGTRSIYFFNTHLPHNHGEAGDSRTHARIAQSLLQKRRELGIENEPTIVTGDMNSHASNFNQAPGGGFESNLVDNGFVWAWEARGNPGYPRIDSILYSGAHWTHSDCGDTGTGRSDHTSIACTVTLK